MHVYSGLVAEPAQVLFHPCIILPATDERGHLIVERLNPHFELQRAPGKLPDQIAQGVGKPVGNHLKVQEQARSVVLEKERQDRAAGLEIEVECPIDELELPHAAREERLHRLEELLQWR